MQGNNALEIKMCHCAKYEFINMKCECWEKKNVMNVMENIYVCENEIL